MKKDEIRSLIKKNRLEYKTGAQEGLLRLSLLQSAVMAAMNNAKSLEEAKETYINYKDVVHYSEI